MTEERITPALEACPKGHTPRWHISEHPTIGAEYGLACDCDKTVGLYPTEAEAIAAWNKRASPAPEPVAAMEPVADPLMDEVREALKGFVNDLTNKGRNKRTMLTINHDDLVRRIDAANAILAKLGERT